MILEVACIRSLQLDNIHCLAWVWLEGSWKDIRRLRRQQILRHTSVPLAQCGRIACCVSIHRIQVSSQAISRFSLARSLFRSLSFIFCPSLCSPSASSLFRSFFQESEIKFRLAQSAERKALNSEILRSTLGVIVFCAAEWAMRAFCKKLPWNIQAQFTSSSNQDVASWPREPRSDS